MNENWIRHQSHPSFFFFFKSFVRRHITLNSTTIRHLGWGINTVPQMISCLNHCFLNDIIAVSQQDNSFKNDRSNDFWFNFEPRIQSGWHIPIFSTLSSRAAVIHHRRNKINLSPCRPCRLGSAQTDASHLPEDNRHNRRLLHLYSLQSRWLIWACSHFQLKANSWIGLQYFLNYFNGLVIGRLGTGGGGGKTES